MLILLIGLNVLVVFPFDVPDKYVFYFPTYVIVALLIGVGSARVIRRDKVSSYLFLLFAFLPVIFYRGGSGFLRKHNLVSFTRDLPNRDNYNYFFTPWQNDYYGARKYGVEAFQVSAENSILVADWTPYWVLNYLQRIEKYRKDIVLVSAESLDSNVINSGRKVYLADNKEGYYPNWIFEKYRVKRKGVLFELEKK